MFSIRKLLFTLTACSLSLASAANNPLVEMKTDSGNFVIEVYSDKAPLTAANFLEYVDSGFYNGTIFHRIMPGFVAQGGGFTFDFIEKPTRAPINLEVDNGLKNDYKTLAMARQEYAHSATSQFFVNLQNNDALNPAGRNRGYAVFGIIVQGMESVDKMVSEPRGMYRAFPDAPNYPIRILSAARIKNLADASAPEPQYQSKFKDALVKPQ
jgi:peptidyl-prolyl cis-trans isomerase A (cyclophilin A)